MDQSCSGTNIKYLGFCHVTCTVPTFHRKEVISVWYWHLPPRCFWSCCFIILVFIAFPETSLVKLSNQHYHSAYANIGKFVCCLQWPACHGAMLHCGTAASFPCQLIMPMDSHDCLSDSESCRVGVPAAACHLAPTPCRSFWCLAVCWKGSWLGLAWFGRVDRSVIADRIASGGHWLVHHLAELSIDRLVNANYASLWFPLGKGDHIRVGDILLRPSVLLYLLGRDSGLRALPMWM